MNWLKRLFAPTIFPGSGRHAADTAAPPADTTAEDQLIEQAKAHVAAMAAGEAFRRQYTPEEQVAADVETNNDLAPWTRKLIDD